MKLFLLLVFFFISESAVASHVYYEYGLGKVSAGYDVLQNETEIRKYYLAAEGPGDLKEEVYAYCRHCVEESLFLAGSAAYATPGEAGVKLTAAVNVWNANFPKCMSGRAFAKSLINQFTVGITERREREKGLVIKYTSGQLNAELYNSFYKELDKRLPGGDGANLIRKFAELQAKFNEANIVDINIKVPEDITNVGNRLTQIQTDAAQKLVAGLAAKISSLSRPEKISEAIPLVLNINQGVLNQIAAATHAIENIEHILPQLPPGPAVPNLGDGLGKVGKRMNDLANVAASQPQVVADCAQDITKCNPMKVAESCLNYPSKCPTLLLAPQGPTHPDVRDVFDPLRMFH